MYTYSNLLVTTLYFLTTGIYFGFCGFRLLKLLTSDLTFKMHLEIKGYTLLKSKHKLIQSIKGSSYHATHKVLYEAPS